MRSLTVLAVLAVLTGTAAADSFVITDRGGAVEVIAHGAVAADNARVGVVRERLEIPLSRADRSSRLDSDDLTVRLAEVRGRSARTLSIKLRLEHDGVVALASGVSFVQVGNDLHVTIPRQPRPIAATAQPPPANPAPMAPLVIAPPAIEAPAAAQAPGPTDAIDAPSPTMPPPAASAAGRPVGSSRNSPTSARWWVILGGLALAGAGITAIVRRRRTAPDALEQIEILATCSLGGKARLLWVGAGERELLVAVSSQGVRSLGNWPRGARRAADDDFDRTLADAERGPALPRASASVRRATAPGGTGTGSVESPAVSGLLRLRDRLAPRAATDSDLGDDLDEVDESYRASGGRR